MKIKSNHIYNVGIKAILINIEEQIKILERIEGTEWHPLQASVRF